MKRLTPGHLRDLRASGLTDETIAAAGLYSETDAAVVGRQLAWKGPAHALGPCLAIPFRHVDGSLNGCVRFKPDKPRRKGDRTIKYESPLGAPNRAYFPPGTIGVLPDTSVPLLVTEGEKKSLKADQEGFPCVGLVGTEGWSRPRATGPDGRRVGPRELLDDLAAIAWQGRRVFIAFDSDIITKPEVQWAEWALARALGDRGAVVRVVRLPGGADGKKIGLDDYLLTHSRDDLQQLLDDAQPPTRPDRNTPPPASGGDLLGLPLPPSGFSNFKIVQQEQHGKMVPVRVGLPAPVLGDRLREITDGWPKRVGRLLFVAENDAPQYLEVATDLFAWITRQFEHVDGNPVRWAQSGDDKISKAEFFALLQQTGDAFDAVETYPHEPPLPRHHYLHPKLRGGDGSALRKLLDRFQPATPIDADLILGFFLSLVAGLSPGQRPAWLFTAEDDDDQQGRGVGKTTLVEVAGSLVGGFVSVSANGDMDDVKKRLLSPEARGKRLLVIDNIKSLKFSWDELEALVTATLVSGKQMYVGEGCIPNTFTICLTLNGATLSKDMAQRCVIVKLARPDYSATWREETVAYVEQHRWAILGDLVAILRQPADPLARYSRWGAWERLVVSRLPEPADTQRVIEDRQADVDDDREEAELVREAFAAELDQRRHDPVRENVFIPARVAADIVNEITNERRPTNKASAYLKMLGIGELRKSAKDGVKGWVWCGRQADQKPAVTIKERF